MFRLFFRINQIYRNGTANLDEDDEEELVWEEEEFSAETPAAIEEKQNDGDGSGCTKASSSQTTQAHSTEMGTSTHVPTTSKGAQTHAHSVPQDVNVSEIISVNEHMKERVTTLEEENRRLLTQEEELYRRIQELEAILAAQSIAEVDASSATTTPQSKRSVQKSSVPATTPPTTAYYNTNTPPTAAPSTNASAAAKKKGSTAKKLFDSPSQNAAVAPASAEDTHFVPRAAPVDASPAATSSAPSIVHSQETMPRSSTVPVSVPVAVADHVSLSSDESGVVINKSDANSVDDDGFPSNATATVNGVGTGAVGASPKSTFSSNETAKYLAALDDQDDEEDGWN